MGPHPQLVGENAKMPEAYERLLLEVLAADHSNFVSAQELDASWRIFTPILHELAESAAKPLPYPHGSRGPAAADELAHRFGMSKFGGGINNYVQGQSARKIDPRLSASANDFVRRDSSAGALAAAAQASLLSSAGASAGGSAGASTADTRGATSGAAAAKRSGSDGVAASTAVDVADAPAATPPPTSAAEATQAAAAAPTTSAAPCTPVKSAPATPTHMTLGSRGVPRLHSRSPVSDVDDEEALAPPGSAVSGSEPNEKVAAFSSAR
jgi:hypothetical protein